MKKQLLITLVGEEEAIERVKGYIEDVLSRNKDSAWGKLIDDYTIEEAEGD